MIKRLGNIAPGYGNTESFTLKLQFLEVISGKRVINSLSEDDSDDEHYFTRNEWLRNQLYEDYEDGR